MEGDGDPLFSWIVFAVGCLVVLIWREVARTRQRDVSRRMSRDGIGTRPDIVTEAGALHASGRLRARRKHETCDPLPDVAVSELGAPDLPWRPKQADGFDAWTWFVLCGLLVLGAAAVDDWLDSEKVGGLGVLVILALLCALMAAIVDLCQRVVVDRDGLRVRGLLLDRTIPWSRVAAIKRRSGGEVVLDLGDRTQTLRFDGEDGRPSSRQVAEVLRTVRTQAPATAAESSTRLSWGVFATLAYLAALAAAAAYVIPRL